MINRFKGKKLMFLVLAVTVIASLFFTNVFAASVTQSIKVAYNNVKIVMAGKSINPSDANGKAVEPFIFNKTTYLPVRAIANALNKTIIWNGKTNTVYINDAKYKDGTYKVSYDKFDSHGWKAFVELTIKNNEITSAKFDYVNKDGALKTQDPNYEKNMKAKTGVGPQEYTVKLTQGLMNKQDISSVDTVTGATSGSNEFKELVAAALTNAVKGSTTESIIPLVEAVSYKDGTYKATFDKLDSHGWNAQVELTIKSNVITFCTFDYVDKDGNFKSKNAGYNVSMKAKAGTSPQTYVVQLAQNLLKVQSPLKVDTVTGATSSSSNFKELAEAALGHAQTGDQTTVVLPQKE